MSYPFIIWTMQRTGGTALADLLMEISDHPGAEHEPFNWARDKPREFASVAAAWIAGKDVAALRRSLAGIVGRHILIKHCYDLFNMAFNTELLAAAAQQDYRHILLLRRDESARLISKFVAEAQGTWFQGYGRQVYADVVAGKRALRPIPVDQLIAQYHHARNSTAALRQALAQSGAPVMDVFYEDLYGGARGASAARFGDLLGFLGIDEATIATRRAAFEEATREGGQSTSDILDFIPNLGEALDGLAAAGLPPPSDHARRRLLDELRAQLSLLATSRRWIFAENLGESWPGFSLRFDHASSLAFRIESADMTFANVYFGLKNRTPIPNKSLDEALSLGLGVATNSDTWPWCRHPSPDDDILPIEANWAGAGFESGVRSGALAARVGAAAEAFRVVLGASGFLAVDDGEWASLQRRAAGAS